MRTIVGNRVRGEWFARTLILGGLCALTVAAVERLVSGIAIDHAFPVPVYMVMQVPQSSAEYASASRALSLANGRDGSAQIARAEAARHLVASPDAAVPLLTRGLRDTPASVRGWTFLGESLADPSSAARAATMALLLSPNEYWLNDRRLQLAARLWDRLDGPAREAAMLQVRQLWTFPESRPGILTLLRSAEGTALLNRAYEGRDEEFRSVNYWVERMRLTRRLAE